MTWTIVSLLVAGVLLSGLFSGSETGFYRVARMRLLLDGLSGDRTSRQLLRLTNHPALFVATTLVGNNVANYITSLALVLAAQQLFRDNRFAESVAPLILSPAVFVYCELLPKQLFLQAPNRLLRRTGPLLLLFTLLFLPIASLLWLLGRLLQSVVGQTPLRIRLALARNELQQLLKEGEEAGILQPAQQHLAQQLFAHAPKSVSSFMTPRNRIRSVPLGAPKSEALRIARRFRSAIVPVRNPSSQDLLGYVRVVDLELDPSPTLNMVHPMPAVTRQQSHLQALMTLESQEAELASVEDEQGQTVGLLFADRLTSPLFQEN